MTATEILVVAYITCLGAAAFYYSRKTNKELKKQL